MNYRYKIQGEDIILSPEEHKAIQSQMINRTHALLSFRQGKLGIDTSKVAFFKETERFTEDQENLKSKQLAPPNSIWCSSCQKYHIYEGLGDKKSRIGGMKFLSQDEFYKKMGWTERSHIQQET